MYCKRMEELWLIWGNERKRFSKEESQYSGEDGDGVAGAPALGVGGSLRRCDEDVEPAGRVVAVVPGGHAQLRAEALKKKKKKRVSTNKADVFPSD